ncbi:MAG: ABC transporter ATP-binding protein, partial [Candidatus Izemoplasmatales bacterium]|nr:ABC transporter ATP-binding protein [Candidatus Izemoplasmatales bacterium]
MKLMFKYLKPYWKSVLVIFVLVTLTAMGNLLLPDYMSKMIGEGIKPVYEIYDETSSSFVPTDYCDISLDPDACRVVGQTSDMQVISHYGLIMLGVTLASSLAWIVLSYVSSRVASLTGKSMREDLYQKISGFSLAEADIYGTSTLITRSTNDVLQVQNYMIMFLRMVLRIPIIFVGALIMSWQKARELMNVLLMGLPLLVIIIAVTFVLVVPLFKAIQKKVDNLTRISREGIKGVRVIRAFDKGEREVKRFRNANEDLTGTLIKTGKIMSVLNPAVNMIFSVVILGVVYLSFQAIFGGGTSNYADLANVSAVMQYSFQAMFALLMLTMTFIMYPRAQVSSGRIKEILDQEIIVKDDGNAEYDDFDFKGEISFNNVCFKYQDAEQNVLEGITFKAKPGETVALIGSTGSGKSTTINLLPRFFDVTCGVITIDDIDIRDIKLKKLRSLMGFVPQTATLFSGTIKDNIIYGK